MTRLPTNVHRAYHAHIYFGPETIEQARALTEEVGRLFKVQVGRLHERPVGPHPEWSVQIAFAKDQFDRFVPWLDVHRRGLDVLVHGLSGDALADHTLYAFWLGKEWPLDLTALD